MKHLSARAPNIPTELALLNCSDTGLSLSIPAHIATVSPFFPGEGRCVLPTPWLMNVKWKEVEKGGGWRNFKNSPGEIKSCFNLLCSWLIHDSGSGGEFDQTVTKWPHFKFFCFLWAERKKKASWWWYGNSLSPVHSSQLPAGCDSRKASLALLSLMLLGLSSLRRAWHCPLGVWPSHRIFLVLLHRWYLGQMHFLPDLRFWEI